MKTVMITAAGSASAQSLVEAFHRLGCRVVGSDLYPQSWNAASAALDAFLQVPPVTQREDYLSGLQDFCTAQQVDVLFPLTDVECDVLSGLKEDFLPCAIGVQTEKVQRMCRNKPGIAAFLRERGLCDTIPDWNPYTWMPSEKDFPLLLKPVSGRSSEGKMIAHDQNEYTLALQNRKDYMVQPFLAGPIFTVEVAQDCHGHCWTAVREELLRTVNGLGTTVQLHPDHPLEEICGAIAEAVGIIGVVNMEFIYHEGRYWFLEINPRFSGGVGFLMAVGLDYAMAALCCQAGNTLPPRPDYPSAVLTRSVSPVITAM